MKYFKVLAKCGHVGRNNYILKWFYVKAESGEDAAKDVRDTPRVKHHHKDAIREVHEISLEDYFNGKKLMSNDKYFQVHSRKESRLYNCEKPEDIYPEEEIIKYKKKRNGRRIKYQFLEKKSKMILRGGNINVE